MELTGKKLGKWGEDQAEKFLMEKGVEIVGKNIFTEYGEIDLLGILDDCLIFVEVKTSRTKKFGFPEVSVHRKKAQHIQNAARKYLQEHEEISFDWRIDVVSIEVNSKNEINVNWFENAISE